MDESCDPYAKEQECGDEQYCDWDKTCKNRPPNNNNVGGGKKQKKYNGRLYVIRTGSRGGKYILVKGNKVYV
jgi:hypothetical protein